jgi:hypothetical protein
MRRGVFFKLRVLVTLVAPLASVDIGIAQDHLTTKPARSPATRRADPAELELTRSRTDVIQKIKETRAGTEKLLGLHENDRHRSLEEYERRREHYVQGLIARNEVLQAEHALAEANTRVDEDRRRLAETDMAITEVTIRDELLRLPDLAMGGYSETAMLMRFNGGTLWTLESAPRIEHFFFETFGRALPISASGQTPTHDRLRFDHHNAIDVALHPDSTEGRALLGYLRQSGIPFIAFRNAVPGAATGAHIHIGKASPKN